MKKSVTIRFRAEPEFKEQLESAIKQSRAKNMSDLIRKAATEFLAEPKKEASQ